MSNDAQKAQIPTEGAGKACSNAPRNACKLSDFEIVRSLGEGSFSEVIQAKLSTTGEFFALKIVDKRLALRHKKVQNLKLERALLDQLDHAGIVKLHFTFQDQNSLYFGLELCPQGELFDQIQRQAKLPEEVARVYAAEILDVLVYLRQQKVVHGDLKPENLLLTEAGHLKLIDFGSAYNLSSFAEGYREQDSSLQGTADYTPPEALSGGKGISYEADLWAFGCVLYQMLEGKPPFRAGSEYLTFEKILQLDFRLSDALSASAKDIIRSLLQAEPAARLGASDLTDLQQHPFFDGIEWASLRTVQAPPFICKPLTVRDNEEITWQLSSLALSQPLRYEYDGDSAVRSLPD